MNSPTPTHTPNVTREILMAMTKTDNIDQLRRELQNLAFGVGPTHTDQYGYQWTDRDLGNMAAGMAATATGMVPFINAIFDIFRELNQNSDGDGYFVSPEKDAEIGKQVLGLAECIKIGLKPMQNPRLIITERP